MIHEFEYSEERPTSFIRLALEDHKRFNALLAKVLVLTEDGEIVARNYSMALKQVGWKEEV